MSSTTKWRILIRNQIIASRALETADQNKQIPQIKPHKTKINLRSSTVAVYAGIFILIVALVFLGYNSPQKSSNIATAESKQTSVDNVVATSVAADVAQSISLPVATSVVNLAISTQAQSEYVAANATSVSKPQIISTSSDNRLVVSYTVVVGDTVDSLSARFKISKDTIKWANNLTSDALSAGASLKILPTDGVLYAVKSTDTIESITEKYKADKTLTVTFNDLETTGLKPYTSIIIPDGVLPLTERPGYVPPAPVIAYAGLGTGFGGKTWFIARGTGPCPPYFLGNCTCYSYARRVQLGLPVGGANGLPNWGNASSWAYFASNAGLLVNRVPAVGAIIQNGGGAGHVGVVEQVLENGDINISEMNAYFGSGGWNIVSGRSIPAGNVSQYLYIH